MAVEYRVFGPPGTGKTYWLSRQCERAIYKYQPHEVFAVSFTRAAAAELVGRNAGLPKGNVGTIHSVCYRYLEQPTIIETDKDLLAEWNTRYGDDWPVQGELNLDEPPTDTGSKVNEALMAWNRHRGLLRRGYGAWEEFGVAWQAFKAETGSVDFTDLLLNAPPTIPAKVLLVDEAQDLTPLQWRIVRQWSAGTDTFAVVGDDDQTIYGWLGARPDEFLTDLPAEQIRVLSQSYRLPRAVHAQACEWITQLAHRRQPKEFAPRDADGTLEHRDATWREPEAILSEIQDRAAAGRRVMVLASCGYMLRPLIAELRNRGLLYHNPYRQKRGDWNPIRAGGTWERLRAFLTLGKVLKEDDREVMADGNLWRLLVHLLKSDGIMRHGAKRAIRDAPERLTDPVLSTSNWFLPEALTAIERRDFDWLVAHATARAAPLMAYPLRVISIHGEKAMAERPRICVGTIHSVKGGEAEDVVLFPDISWQAQLNVQEYGFPAWDAIVRQFYVGMTRARETLILCNAAEHGVFDT